jgi:hypothetical protein
MVKIEKILDYSKDSQEAILLVSDGQYSCEAFCHPYDIDSSPVIAAPLTTLLVREIVRVESDSQSITALHDQGLSQRIIARVVDLHPPIVAVGEIHIEVDGAMPGDIRAGDTVEFICVRLDLPYDR